MVDQQKPSSGAEAREIETIRPNTQRANLGATGNSAVQTIVAIQDERGRLRRVSEG